MGLLEKQQAFARLLAELILWINEQGWRVTHGDFNRPDLSGHAPHSLHYIRLAADLNLFVGGVYRDQDCDEWQRIGAKWLSLNPLCAWGGKFKILDLNHFSLSHNGME